jgi:hypothetical protein
MPKVRDVFYQMVREALDAGSDLEAAQNYARDAVFEELDRRWTESEDRLAAIEANAQRVQARLTAHELNQVVPVRSPEQGEPDGRRR